VSNFPARSVKCLIGRPSLSPIKQEYTLTLVCSRDRLVHLEMFTITGQFSPLFRFEVSTLTLRCIENRVNITFAYYIESGRSACASRG
jgi:hypothetical protein